MRSKAVIGCGFGDEGKGKTISYLVSQTPNPLVIRYSGGQQAGHHVMLKDCDHVFSNFGSGTLQGAPTYWSKFCTVDPVGILNEYDILVSKGITPKLYIDAKCPVTTPYDKEINKIRDSITLHGTCGVGVGATLQREEKHYSILVEDLFYPSVLRMKLELLRRNYCMEEKGGFVEVCLELIENRSIRVVDFQPWGDNRIYEGSQGLLLDQNFGFFPHVTRASTGVENIEKGEKGVELFYVTRAYQTRHGNGPMTYENFEWAAPVNPYEQNSHDGYQGKFRVAPLDLDLLRYGLKKDGDRMGTLVITCLDLMKEYVLMANETVYRFKDERSFTKFILNHLGFRKALLSRSPLPEMEEI